MTELNLDPGSPWGRKEWDTTERLHLHFSLSCSGEGNGNPLQYSGLENPTVAKSRTRLSDFTFTFHFHALEKEMATHSSILAWRIPGTREPGGLPSVGLHRVGHDWSDLEVVVVVVWIHLGRINTWWTFSILSFFHQMLSYQQQLEQIEVIRKTKRQQNSHLKRSVS